MNVNQAKTTQKSWWVGFTHAFVTWLWKIEVIAVWLECAIVAWNYIQSSYSLALRLLIKLLNINFFKSKLQDRRDFNNLIILTLMILVFKFELPVKFYGMMFSEMNFSYIIRHLGIINFLYRKFLMKRFNLMARLSRYHLPTYQKF